MGEPPLPSERPFILASGSPRRRELLREACFEPRIVAPEVDETPRRAEPADALALRLALEKARAVAAGVSEPACVLAADTVVVIGDELLGKPQDAEDAARMLLRLAGRTHRVLTGFALVATGDDLPAALRVQHGVEESRVTMRPVSAAEAREYAATGEPLDKAGAYAAQGIGARFVESIAGSRSNVIGLPLERVVPLLERLGVRPACRSS
jgi:septum formation protein